MGIIAASAVVMLQERKDECPWCGMWINPWCENDMENFDFLITFVSRGGQSSWLVLVIFFVGLTSGELNSSFVTSSKLCYSSVKYKKIVTSIVLFKESATSAAEQCAWVWHLRMQLHAEFFMEMKHFLLRLCAAAGKQWDIVKASVFSLVVSVLLMYDSTLILNNHKLSYGLRCNSWQYAAHIAADIVYSALTSRDEYDSTLYQQIGP